MSILSYFRNRRQAHLGSKDLLQMSEAQLRDLGIEPGQVGDVAAKMIAARAENPAPDALLFKAAVFARVDWPGRRKSTEAKPKLRQA